MHDIPNRLSLLTLDLPETLVAIVTGPSSCTTRLFFGPSPSSIPLLPSQRLGRRASCCFGKSLWIPRVELKLNKIAMVKLQVTARFPLTVFCGGTGQKLQTGGHCAGFVCVLFEDGARARKESRRGIGLLAGAASSPSEQPVKLQQTVGPSRLQEPHE